MSQRLQKVSLKQFLDDDKYVDEMIDRNPQWVLQLEKIIEDSISERHLGRKVSSKNSR